jgi:hypothetical protein
MSQSQTSQRDQALAAKQQQYAKTLHNVALCTAIACPVLALLPPRKLDVFTFSLVGTTIFSANYLCKEQTGRSIWQHLDPIAPRLAQASPAVAMVEEANAAKELSYAKQDRPERESNPVTKELEATKSARQAWKVQREKEIQDDLDVGKGFGEMIMDQIWGVWNWDKKKDGDEEDGDR